MKIKNVIAAILAGSMALSLVACGASSAGSPSATSSSNSAASDSAGNDLNYPVRSINNIIPFALAAVPIFGIVL